MWLSVPNSSLPNSSFHKEELDNAQANTKETPIAKLEAKTRAGDEHVWPVCFRPFPRCWLKQTKRLLL